MDNECESDSFCGLNNCPESLGVSSDVDCCEPKGKTITIIMIFFENICKYCIIQILF